MSCSRLRARSVHQALTGPTDSGLRIRRLLDAFVPSDDMDSLAEARSVFVAKSLKESLTSAQLTFKIGQLKQEHIDSTDAMVALKEAPYGEDDGHEGHVPCPDSWSQTVVSDLSMRHPSQKETAYVSGHGSLSDPHLYKYLLG